MGVAREIIDNPLRVINISGVPGAGKTSLTVSIANEYSEKRFLYLSFGKENTANALSKFGNNVTCLSIHTLAKRTLEIPSNRLIPIANLSTLNQAIKNTDYALSSAKELACLLTMLDIFCVSSLTLQHSHELLAKKELFPSLTRLETERLNIAFKGYWKSLWIAGSQLPVTHDMYLKEFTLRRNILNYDVIFIDEKQDLSEAMYHLIEQFPMYNPNSKFIGLGDPCQQIYGFRGSCDYFSREKFQYRLDYSYRFGKKLCLLSNAFMAHQGVSYYTPIVSDSDHTDICPALGSSELLAHIRAGGRPTFISRYNISLWNLLMFFAENNIPCSIAGGMNQSEFKFLDVLHTACQNRNKKYKELSGMGYDAYKHQAKMNDDRPALLSCRFIESIKADNKTVFKKIVANIKPKNKSQVLLSTVFQAKGLEFQEVCLMKDFPCITDKKTGRPVFVEREEVHLLYTAITRAKSKLRLPNDWYTFWSDAKRKSLN